MSRFTFLLLLTPLLVLPACDPNPEPGAESDTESESDTEPESDTESESESDTESGSDSTVEEDAEAYVALVLEFAVQFCECAVEGEGVDPEPCAEAVEEEFGAPFRDCILSAMSMYPSAREALRCEAAVLRDYIACSEGEAVCLDATTDDDPDDPCTLAADAADEECEDPSPEADAALDECFATDEDEDCSGEDC